MLFSDDQKYLKSPLALTDLGTLYGNMAIIHVILFPIAGNTVLPIIYKLPMTGHW